MDPILDALGEQQRQLSTLVADLDDAGWHAPTRCDGWDVSDVVLHLAQTNEMAIGSATQRFDGQHVVLVDDVYTSGATTDACARVARRAGAAKVSVLCWARVIRDD